MLVTLWTVMPKSVYQTTILSNGVYLCNDNKCRFMREDKKIEKAYNWLSEKMKQLIGNPIDPNTKHPVWAWYQLRNKQERPDLRWIEFKGYREPMVLIEFCKNRQDILLSDEPRWTYGPLNDCPCWSMNKQTCNQERNWYYELDVPPESKETWKKETWNRVFDVSNTEHIQATFWQLQRSEIKKVWIFNEK